MSNSFIKNFDLIKEDSKVESQVDLSLEVQKIKNKIKSIPSKTSLAIVGKFGSGKSTALYQLQVVDKENLWLDFDAWKYPARNDLWEGFVLDIAEQIGKLSKVTKRIDGKSSGKPIVDILTDIAASFSNVPGLNVIDKIFNRLFESSPATRVFELQRILLELFNKSNKPLVIVIEDVDRSGDKGVYFLETLKNFLQTNQVENRVVFIIPIATSSYHENIESYLKSVDYFEFFEPGNPKLHKFVESVFDPELFSKDFRREGDSKIMYTGKNVKAQIVSFLESLFAEYPFMTFRLLKLILRKANVVYQEQIEDGHSPDFRVTLCFETAKYINISEDPKQSFFNRFKESKSVIRGNIFSAFLGAMLHEKSSIYTTRYSNYGNEVKELINPRYDFKCIVRENGNIQSYPSYPWSFGRFGDDTGLGITEFYLNY